ncbi:MAG: TonB-dependent receptor, partial [Pseudomonadota bacterium]
MAAPLMYSQAQAAAAEPDEKEEILVTGTRIRTSGMESPNPTTVITLEEVSIINPNSLVDALAALPIFNGSATAESFNSQNPNGFNFFASPGNGSLNLRGLASRRTLTLLNGRRVVSSTIFGGPSITMFPQQLMRSVEAVTGGATAAYGTDAVAGVVNYILNTDYEGLRANARYGILENGRGESNSFGVSGGFKVAEKGHMLLSFETQDTPAIFGRDGFDWYTNTRFITNPDPLAGNSLSNPRLIPRPNVVSRVSSLDGILTFPTNTAIPKYIMDANGNASEYKLGTYFDANNNSQDGGGSGTVNDEFSRQIRSENRNENMFAYFDYDLTENLNVFVQGIYGTTYSSTVNTQNLVGGETTRVEADGITPTTSAPMIFSGNPYIPANIQATANFAESHNIPYLKISKINTPMDIGLAEMVNDSQMTSVTTGFQYEVESDGFFDGWMVNGWAQSGHTDTTASQKNPVRQDRVYLAMDAVRDANGNIVCNVTRFPNAPQNAVAQGCKPLNPFGRGMASPESIAWVTGYEPGTKVATNGYFLDANGKRDPIYYEYVSGNDKARLLDLRQDAAEITADGQIFDGWGAGPISMALGYAWREESYQQVVQAAGVNPAIDPFIRTSVANNAAIGRRGVTRLALNSAQDVFISAGPFGKGDSVVREAFTEFNIPLLANKPFAQEVVFGAATRWADYAQAGEVWSWKGQLSWRINEQLRLRGTVSQDVRAANMAERTDRNGAAANIYDILETPDAKAIGTTAQYQSLTTTFGQPDLVPENAKTFTAGFVYQPSWVEGLQFSLDWYDTTIKNNIVASTSAQEVLDSCYEDKIQRYCDFILREGPDSNVPGLKRISNVLLIYINRDWIESGGVDFEASYSTDLSLFGGRERATLRFLGSYIDYQNTSTAGTVTSRKGVVVFGTAPWQTNLNASYSRDNLSLTLGTSYDFGIKRYS